MSLIEPALASLAQHYPLLAAAGPLRIRRVEGGFSEAGIWKLEGVHQSWAIRVWPGFQLREPRIPELHRWLAHLSQAELPVAVPLNSKAGTTLVDADTGYLQLEPWLPGEPEPTDQPSEERLQSSLHTLARLHLRSQSYDATPAGAAWFAGRVAPAPAVVERRQLLEQWTPQRIQQAAAALRALAADEFRDTAQRMLSTGQILIPPTRAALSAVASLSVPLVPCLRDVHRDHLLFTGNDVTGIIDASAARVETVSADLSRWLGSLLGDQPARWEDALHRYAAIRPLSAAERQLLPVLDQSNVLLSSLYWVDRLATAAPLKAASPLLDRLRRLEARLKFAAAHVLRPSRWT